MNKLSVQLILLVLLSLCTTGCFFYTTGPNEVGVKVRKFTVFGSRGVDQSTYAPGMTHFYMPIITEFYTFDSKLQNMEMTVDPNKGDIQSRDDLLFKTIDGNDISLDLIITYRIDPAKAPTILEKVARNDYELRQKIVRAVARSKPRDIFGELTTEQFYVSNFRDEKSVRAKEILNEILNPYGVIVERVSTKDYRFNPAYQKAIEDKKVADQQAEKNRAAAQAAVEEWRKKLEDAQAEVNEMVAAVDGRLRQAKLEADAYFQKQEQISQAIKVEGINEAKSITKMNQALAGSGGDVMVKLKIAEALQGKKIMLLPTAGYNVKTLNLNDFLDLKGVEKITKEVKPAKTPTKKKAN